MPFLLVDNFIRFTYASGDPKGGTEALAVTMEDYYQADISNGWGYLSKVGNMYVVNGMGLSCTAGYLNFEGVEILVINNPRHPFDFSCAFKFTKCVFKQDSWNVNFNTRFIGNVSYDNVIEKCVIIGYYYCYFQNVIVNKSYVYGQFRAIYLNQRSVLNYTQLLGVTDLGVTPNGANVSLRGVSVFDCQKGLYLRTNYVALNSVYKGLVFVGNVTCFHYYTSGTGSVYLKMVDCDVDETSYLIATPCVHDALTEFASTFIWNLGDSVGIELYDKDSNLVLSKTVSNGDEDEVVFCKHNLTGSTKTLALTYQRPFTLIAKKTGYDDLMVTVNPIMGVQTPINGTLLETVPAPPVPPQIASLNIVNPGTGDNDGQIQITAGEGTQPYTYALNGGEYGESDTFTGLSEGVYTVSVKDANDLTDTIAGIALKKSSPIVYYDKKPALTTINKRIPSVHLKPVLQPVTLKKATLC